MYLPKISVIIPSYNRKKTLTRAIDSVLEQDYQNTELILVDDGSSDGTNEIIKKKYLESVIYVQQANKGVSSARNTGTRLCSGDWIAFLDSDDYWHPTKLSRQIKALNEQPDLNILQTQEIWVRNGKRVNQRKKHTKPKGWIFEESLKLCCISPSSVIVRKALLSELGGFDEDMLACEDYDLWLRITANNPIGLVDQFLLTKTGGHSDQLSSKYLAMDRFRIYSLLKILSLSTLSKSQIICTQKQLDHKLYILFLGARKRSQDRSSLKQLVNDVQKNSSFAENREALQDALLSDNWFY